MQLVAATSALARRCCSCTPPYQASARDDDCHLRNLPSRRVECRRVRAGLCQLGGPQYHFRTACRPPATAQHESDCATLFVRVTAAATVLLARAAAAANGTPGACTAAPLRRVPEDEEQLNGAKNDPDEVVDESGEVIAQIAVESPRCALQRGTGTAAVRAAKKVGVQGGCWTHLKGHC
jgi:hypothetical protein